MTAAPGWYPYDGDPAGTVRRWNGAEWIGFPTTPPPEVETGPTVNEAYAASAGLARRPFRNQQRLLPYALLACVGLVASIAGSADVLFELRGDLEATRGLLGSTEIDAPAISDPFNHTSSRRLLMALFGGGALFLFWLIRAHRNTGKALIRPQRRYGWGFIRFLLWPFIAVLGWILGPVMRTMGQLVEQSGDGPDKGKINPLTSFAWRILWVASAYLVVLSWLAHSAGQLETTRRSTNIMIVLLGGHIASLVLALWLVIIISIHQDRRLKG